MAKSRPAVNVDLSQFASDITSQFRDLNFNEPGQWPVLPKAAAFLFVAAVVVVAGWFLVMSEQHRSLDAARAREPVLKADYTRKLAQAVNLEALRKQKLEVQEYVTQLEKQLPGKAEMDALLSDINQAGLGRGLQFELFRPGQVVVKEYYAELPITLRVSGRYHDFGQFAGDVAALSRIVTLHDLAIGSSRDAKGSGTGLLTMDAVARTYRYLDPEEVAEQRRQQQAKAKGKGGRK